jgi:membrane dipeptidase
MLSNSVRLLSLAATLLAGCATNPRALHENLLTLDTHLDTPMLFGVEGWDITERHSVATEGSQVDLPRMIDGGLDGGFFVTYIPQGPLTPEGRAAARDAALRRIDEIRAMVARHADKFALALVAEDVPRIVSTGRRFVMLSMENGYPVGEDLSLLQRFHSLGVRVAGPVHFLNNDLGSSATDARPVPWRGLSPLGEQWVAEANRLGILIDASHSSDAVLERILELSQAPIILTHSGARAVFDHPRNATDAQLRRMAAQGGVIQVSAYSDYMVRNDASADRAAAIGAVRRLPARTLAQREAQRQRLNEIEREHPASRAAFEDFIAHLLHVIRVAGVDHAGIGIDFDGGGGVEGLDEASDYPKITARLLKEGLSRADLQKIWSGNALRVIAAAEACAATLSTPVSRSATSGNSRCGRPGTGPPR